ncbi:MAG TPA: DUF4352 domain-containing protein [Arachnia sp.]|nr:DUF4352 domain-containing protein [Arachnia sp.]HMT87890.1 DUF4352 domain-containing protein [Arachnia sp.]
MIIVIVLLGIIVNLASGGDDNKAAGPAETPAATQTASDPAETEPGETATEDAPADETPEAPADETPEAPAAGLGDPVTSGDWTFTVSKVSDPVAKIGDEHFNTQAHGEFILMDVSITNEGDSAAYLMANQIKLTSGGKTFESSSDAAFYMGDAAVPIFDEINPGLTVEGKIAFDVPKGTAPEQVLFNGGLFADDAAISLK